jgi:hypothetical protein
MSFGLSEAVGLKSPELGEGVLVVVDGIGAAAGCLLGHAQHHVIAGLARLIEWSWDLRAM